ncbi:MAG: SpoIIE family protein phosphatase [Muribaculaceae bacterium]|nr:SpoIIE family protein phosphatase [Muribaculaceae bacterium]
MNNKLSFSLPSLGGEKGALKKINEAIGANGIILIVVAALLLIAIYIIQYQFTRKEINEDVRLRSQNELFAKSLTIRGILNEVETAVRNHTDDVIRNLTQPDSMYGVAKNIVELNPKITGVSVSFIEDYFPKEGHWFEAYAVRDSLGNISMMQLGSEDHDYFQSEFFKTPYQTGKPMWTNPYLDKDGAKMMLTTYSVPVRDKEGVIVAVLDADISLNWLDEVLAAEYAYPSSYHVLLSRTGQLMSIADSNFLLKTIPEMSEAYDNNTFLPLNEGMMSGESGETVIIDKKGDKYLTYYMPVDQDTGWSIAIINSEKEIFGDFHKMRVTILWLSIAGFLILVLIIVRAILNIRKLEKVTSERERIQSELEIASGIQLGMLPKSDFIESVHETIEVDASLDPAKEVGGDLYDYFIKGKYLYFCIGDVSGKGVPAALFMAVARSLFRALAAESIFPSEIVSGMNNTLIEFNERDMFVTLFLGVLDMKTGRLNYCNAGHDAPYILDSNGVTELNVIPNLPLGIFSGFDFQSQMVQLRKGSLIFLYTDGLTEAMNEKKQEFGEKRMIEYLSQFYSSHPDTSPKELVNFIKTKVKEFVGKAEQSDDLTLMAFKFLNSDNFTEKSITLRNEISEISNLNKFVEEICRNKGLPDNFINDLKLAIEEVVANSINYGFDNDEKGKIIVSLKFQPEEILVEIKDNGREFDPTVEKEVDIDSTLEFREIGGLGLFLVKELTDSISYRRVGNLNILSMTKSFNSEPKI